MATTELQQLSSSKKTNNSNAEMQTLEYSEKRGGWITFPFITGALVGLTLGVAGWMTNLVVYLIEKFHVSSINATQIFNVINGCTSLLPLVAAFIADSLLGCFSVIWISSLFSLLGIVLLALTAILHSLRPQACEVGSSLCAAPTKLQFAVLYLGIALASVGLGGTRFTMTAMGADQFNSATDQAIFINWYVVILYASAVTGATVIVYVEDSVSWALGLDLCVATTIIGLAIFLLGSRYYRRVKLEGSPYTSIARVVIAAIRKRKVPLLSRMEDYYHGDNGGAENEVSAPTKSLRFLNHAARKVEGDIRSNGSIAKPWNLCSVQQVEDLKKLMKIFPLLSSSVFISTPIAVLSSLTVLQALAVDRQLGPHFKIPAGSMIVFTLSSTAISLVFIDRLVYPSLQKITHWSPTPLQRIGAGHVFNVVGMAVGALIESKRLKIAQTNHLVDQTGAIVPMSVLWLVPQMAVVGFGEAFHYPGQVTFYYQEFPKSLGSTATAMISLIMGIAYYLSTAVIDLIRRITTWLPDNINQGRIDNVYWTLVVLGALNFGYFLICAKYYKYQNKSPSKQDTVPRTEADILESNK